MSKQHDIVASQDSINEYDEDAVLNPSANPHFDDILAARLSRRVALKGGITTAASALLGGSILSACGSSDDSPAPAPAPAPAPQPAPLKIGFTAVAKNKNDLVTVADGYNVSILHALGDPLHFGDTSWQDDGSESAESYNRRVGDGHDGMYWFGMSDAGAFDAKRSDRGLLAVNHEYVVAPYGLHPAGRAAGAARNATEVEKEIYAHGISVVEVKRDATGTGMSMVRGSRYNRRVTSATTMDITGPAKGSVQLQTLFSPTAVQTRGTNNNCANGYTPWGTYLTCEENYLNVISRAAGDDAQRSAKDVASLNRYGLPQNRKSPYLWETAGTADLFARWNSSVTGAAATADYRNTINTFGWVVEIDPFAPDSVPAKRTALGRFNHEGAWPAEAVAGKPIVIYMGDDSRNEYIYKFVSKANWDAADVGKGMAAGAKYLDEGTLYVAKFNADGSGTWVELSFGKNGLDATNATYAFADQGDVLINARIAGDIVGATKMDRPEWGAVHPTNGEIYMTLTNNSNRVANTATPTGSQLKPDAANPRYYEDMKGAASQKGNPNGHIIRWKEDAADVTKLTWDVYLFGAQADAAADVNLSALADSNDFSSPDGLYFDKRGMLWIQTDDGAYTDITNCMMLAALPGKVGDGAVVNAAGGTQTRAGAKATSDTLRRFLVGPKECEITGIAMTPDAKTLFFNVQHPGEETAPDWNAKTFGSYWPANQADPTVKKRPRSATVVITRKDGGEIGI
ncbi:PhoX family protein [Roseateles noduli]|uniref:PhoX family protein n=1 Tax=Roseateles noduli TaxID=2052484 RepID=UPI003D6459FB